MKDVVLRSALHALDRAEALLSIATEHDMLEARLAPDMWTLRQQIWCATGFAQRAVLPLSGGTPPDTEPDLTHDGLVSAIRGARVALASAEGPMPERIAHRAGEATLNQSVPDYVATFALPNMWFHLSMAYAILRAGGIEIGKAAFDGLHAY